jgi:hypothetical protein
MEKSAELKRTHHPNFILGIASLILMIVGVVVTYNGFRAGDYILIGSVAMGAIHWIWSIIDVINHQPNKSQSKVFWIILVVIIPPVGGLLYYAFSRTVRM